MSSPQQAGIPVVHGGEDVNEAENGRADGARAVLWSAAGSLGRFTLAHGLLLVALAAAAAVRWIVTLGYPSVLWFGDSLNYLKSALIFEPSDIRPSGYGVLLWMLKPLHSFLWVVGVQHALGIGIGVMAYALVWRAARSAWPHQRWLPGLLGTACALPVLFNAHQIQLEHLLMADLIFTFLLVAAVTMVVWPGRSGPMSWWAGALAGLLISGAAVVRTVGLPLLLLVVVCMVLRRVGWRPIVAMLAAAVIPIVAYMSWFSSVHGEFAMTTSDNIWLYGRTVAFADCSVISPTPEASILCREGAPVHPDVAPAYAALWGEESGFLKLPLGIRDPKANELAGEFAWAAIKKQPGDWFEVSLRDTLRAFEWDRPVYPTPWTAASYEFRPGAALRVRDAPAAYEYGGRTAVPRVVEPYGAWVLDYQRSMFVPGPILAGLLIIGAVGLLVRIRKAGGRVLLPWGMAAALLVVPAATADFDARYVLPAIPFAALAALLSLIPERRPYSTPVQIPERPTEVAERTCPAMGGGSNGS